MNLKKTISALFMIISCSMMDAKKHKPVAPLKQIKNTGIVYQLCQPSHQLNFKPFPIEYKPKLQPHNPTIFETFILHIPNGKVYAQDGFIMEKDRIINDFGWQNNVSKQTILKNLKFINVPKPNLPISKVGGFPTPTKIAGTVAVITGIYDDCYYHWMADTIGRLLLLESQNIEFDYLFAPTHKPYMIESLELLGINRDKIIDSYKKNTYIEADELIVPSFVNRTDPAIIIASYPSLEIINLLRHKILPKIESLLATNPEFLSKRIFISRKDANTRKLTNEDDLFEQLEPYGFQRYCLGELSFLEQVTLFNYADVIVGLHGAGLVNLIFSQPGTHVIEIFQARADATYWYMGQNLSLRHTCIKTDTFDYETRLPGMANTTISQAAIDKIIDAVSRIN